MGLPLGLGELKKRGIRTGSRHTVVNIMKEHGLDPGPQRGNRTWDGFLKIHVDTLWQGDFVANPMRMWTVKRMVNV